MSSDRRRALLVFLLQELFTTPYNKVPFHKLSNHISPIDCYYPHSKLFTFLTYPLAFFEWFVPRYLPSVRREANRRLLEMVKMEDENTNGQTVGPVSKAFHIVARFVGDGPE